MKLNLKVPKLLTVIVTVALAVMNVMAPLLPKRFRQEKLPTVDTMADDMIDHGMF